MTKIECRAAAARELLDAFQRYINSATGDQGVVVEAWLDALAYFPLAMQPRVTR